MIVVVVAAVVVAVDALVAYSIPYVAYFILHSDTYVISRWGYSDV